MHSVRHLDEVSDIGLSTEEVESLAMPRKLERRNQTEAAQTMRMWLYPVTGNVVVCTCLYIIEADLHASHKEGIRVT